MTAVQLAAIDPLAMVPFHRVPPRRLRAGMVLVDPFLETPAAVFVQRLQTADDAHTTTWEVVDVDTGHLTTHRVLRTLSPVVPVATELRVVLP